MIGLIYHQKILIVSDRKRKSHRHASSASTDDSVKQTSQPPSLEVHRGGDFRWPKRLNNCNPGHEEVDLQSASAL
jgi:hypothetical protein